MRYIYVSRWFDRRRGSALALISSGSDLAGALWPPVFERAVTGLGRRRTMLWYAVLKSSPRCRWPRFIFVIRPKCSIQPLGPSVVPGKRACSACRAMLRSGPRFLPAQEGGAEQHRQHQGARRTTAQCY